MRVLHIIARFNVGGTATWISNLSQSLDEAGHKSFVMSGYVQEGEEEDSRFKSIGGVRVPNLGRRLALVGDIKALFEISKRDIFRSISLVFIEFETSIATTNSDVSAEPCTFLFP